MIRRALSVCIAALAIVLVAASPAIVVTGQLLAYQDGYVFFTTGDGFHVAPNVVIHDAKTNGPTTIVPAPRVYARATFDSSGTVTELDLSRAPLPPQGDFADVSRFAIAMSSPVPNPDLIPTTPAPGQAVAPDQTHFSGRPVLVTFTAEVPPNTPFTATVYITTDASGWNAQAIPMDRVDALHYSITRRLNSGTIFRYLFDRGSFQSVEIGENGLQLVPRQIVVTDADVRVINNKVYAWLDSTGGGYNQAPTGIPTPYNPAPFPNLPPGVGPPGAPAPCSNPATCVNRTPRPPSD